MKKSMMIVAALLIAGCHDTSKNEQHTDAATKTEVAQDRTTTRDGTSDQYHAEGLPRYDNDQTTEAPAEEPSQTPEQAPIRIELKLNSAYAEYGLGKIEVQATTDQVTINQVILNRGQCSAIDNSIKMPITLSFGRTYTGYINNCSLDKIIEVQVNTNLGNWTFNP